MIILGADPGFASFGISAVDIAPSGAASFAYAEVIRTKPSAKKRNVRATDDATERARHISQRVTRAFALLKPRAVCAEAFSQPRNASAAAKVATARGIMIHQCETAAAPLLEASPQMIKLVTTGRRCASKAEVQDAVCDWLDLPAVNIVGATPKSLHEHIFDSLAAIRACLEDNLIRMILARRSAS